MKNKRLTRIFSLITIIVLLCLFAFSGCKKENTYYQIPEYVSNKTEEEHYVEITKRAENILCEKGNVPKEGGYNVEMVYNFSEQPQYFAVVYFNGNGYLGIILNDQYYYLNTTRITSDKTFFDQHEVLNQEKYFGIMGNFYLNSRMAEDQLVVAIKKDGKFYRVKFDGLSDTPETELSQLDKKVILTKDVYNPTLDDALEVYLKDFIN